MSDKIDLDVSKLKIPRLPNIVRGAYIPPNIEKMIEDEEKRKAERKLQHVHLWINTSVSVASLIVSVIALFVSLMQ